MKTGAMRDYTGREQCRAVLAVWTEKRSVKQVCGELAVSAKVFQLWQERAMDGILRALQPREGLEEERGPALAPKMKRLLERRAMEQEGRLPRLTKRLATVGTDPALSSKAG